MNEKMRVNDSEMSMGDELTQLGQYRRNRA